MPRKSKKSFCGVRFLFCPLRRFNETKSESHYIYQGNCKRFLAIEQNGGANKDYKLRQQNL